LFPVALPAPTTLLYFDHNATTSLAPEVAETMAAALREVYGNASSMHREGQRARQKLEQSRQTLAAALGGLAQELVFTSGGTEANNLAILGLVRNLPGERKHVITTAIEHAAVLEPCRQLEREGVAVSYVGVGKDCLVNPEEIIDHLRPETVLVSVMHANNETGAIQPVAAIGALIRERHAAGQSIYFHSDGVQAFGKVPVSVERLDVDLYSVSAHKLFAPKGIGALWVRKGVPLKAIQFGGRHERERRAGTENVPSAIAFARAVELCLEQPDAQIAELRNLFEAEVTRRVPDAEVNGSSDNRLPSTSNLMFHDLSGENLVIALDMQGIAVSSGSACSSGSIEPSHVLLAMGRSRDEARGSVRFSFGRYNRPADVEKLIDAVTFSVERLRKASRRSREVAV